MPVSWKSRAPLLLLVVWCLTLLAVRTHYSRSMLYDFMAWNLFLAAVPVVAAGAFRVTSGWRGSTLLAAALFATWLAFLPNAPYMVTDLMHLAPRPPVPLWYDIVLLGSFAGTGMMLAYVSVADVEAATRDRAGRFAAALTAYGALVLSGFGIYLGRFLRWNSWDVVASPFALLGEIASRLSDPLSHPRTWAVTAVYGTAMALGYFALKGMASSITVDVARNREAPRHGLPSRGVVSERGAKRRRLT